MTKTNYCTTNNAIGYYPLDSYGYNTILIHLMEFQIKFINIFNA